MAKKILRVRRRNMPLHRKWRRTLRMLSAAGLDEISHTFGRPYFKGIFSICLPSTFFFEFAVSYLHMRWLIKSADLKFVKENSRNFVACFLLVRHTIHLSILHAKTTQPNSNGSCNAAHCSSRLLHLLNTHTLGSHGSQRASLYCWSIVCMCATQTANGKAKNSPNLYFYFAMVSCGGISDNSTRQQTAMAADEWARHKQLYSILLVLVLPRSPTQTLTQPKDVHHPTGTFCRLSLPAAFGLLPIVT